MSVFSKIMIVSLSLSFCSSSFAQAVSVKSSRSVNSIKTNRDGTMSLDFAHTSLAAALDLIGTTIQCKFQIDSSMRGQLTERVDYQAENVRPADVLAALASDHGLRFLQTDPEERSLLITATKADEDPVLPIQSFGEYKIRQVLAKPAPLMLVGMPLEMVVQFASGMTNLPLELDRAALQEAGISSQQPVSLNSDVIPVGKLIANMLQPLGLELVVRHDLAVITVAERNQRKQMNQ